MSKQNKKKKRLSPNTIESHQHLPEENTTEKTEAIDLLKHIKELASLKYESELYREQSLIQQSSQMQTVFSFVTAAVFMAIPVIIEFRGEISLEYFLVSIATIVFFILLSLIFASLAQWRWKTKTFPNIDEIYNFVECNWKDSLAEEHQLKLWIDLVGKIQKEKAELNSRRVILIMISMVSFYISILSVVIFFAMGIIKLI